MNGAICPSCGKETGIKTKTKKISADIQRTYLQCQHCKHKETAYYTDKEIRKMLSRQKVLRNNQSLKISAEKRKDELRFNQMVINNRMVDLRKKIEGDVVAGSS